jgi:Arc/MetJ-type ribon-helix-helix transcriptional regulator
MVSEVRSRLGHSEDPMPDLPIPVFRRKRLVERAVRKTVQIPGYLIGALDDRAQEEARSLAAIVRLAIRQMIQVVNETGEMPARSSEAVELRIRTGRRGPATQWPERVSYVIPRSEAELVALLARDKRTSEADVVRQALELFLEQPPQTARPLRTTDTGFITASPPHGPHARARQTVELFNTVKKRS